MHLQVERLADGPGQIERLQVEGELQPYVGVTVRVPDGAGHWLMYYANSTRDKVSRLEGELAPGRSTWTALGPGAHGSRLVCEQPDPDHWRRTQFVSSDGGGTWTVLFTDELTRDAPGSGP